MPYLKIDLLAPDFQTPIETTFPVTVDEVISKQLFRAHTTELLDAGDYKLVVKSRGGDAEGPLQTSFRRVKYLHVVDPAPPVPIAQSEDGTVKVFTLTDGGQDATFTAGNEWTMTGEGLFTEAATGRRWKIASVTVNDIDEFPGVSVSLTASGDGRSVTLVTGSELPPEGSGAAAFPNS